MKRLLILCALAISVWAMPAQAVTLFFEDWEGSCAEVTARWGGPTAASYYSVANGGFPCGYGYFNTVVEQPFFLDSSVKFAGSASLRLNFTGTQDDIPPHGGGYVTRSFPRASEIWLTYYDLMGTNFHVAGAPPVGAVVTKGIYLFMQSATTCSTSSGAGFTIVPCGTPGSELQVNGWVFQNFWGQRQMWISAQGIKDAPIPYGTHNFTHNVQVYNQPDNKWICYEAHIRNNTPGLANGLYEQFATNVTDGGPTILTSRQINRRFLGDTPNDVMPSDSQWSRIRMYRQAGLGQRYYDNITISTTRIGCTGGITAPPDTKAPAGPIGLVAN
jgi:hypothetical protein